MAAARRFFSSLSRRRVARALFVSRCLSQFPFSAPPPPLHLYRAFSTDPCHRRAGLLSPLPLAGCDQPGALGFGVDLVDPDLWHISSALTQARGPSQVAAPTVFDEMPETKEEEEDGEGEEVGDFPDLDEIEELRLRKKLFYKLDRGSMEFEECSLGLFRRQKSKLKKKQLPESRDPRNSLEPRKKETILKLESPRTVKPKKPGCDAKAISAPIAGKVEVEEVGKKKRARTPTFNQLTDPYHLPFCLDIYISKGSVRACIIHRATSKVVAVAHSISKDMKFDLTSRRNAAACAAVGAALAQRALSDDIHNLVYTPRKGEKIEGKLQVVLQSILDSGIDVKVKIKQRKNLKGRATAS